MKKHFSLRYLAINICLISLVLMSYAPKLKVGDKVTNDLNKEDLKKLVDKVSKDSVFTLIYKKDINNLLSKAHNTSTLDKDRMNELSKKTKLSVDELTYIVSNLFGFKDANDYTHYIDLYRYLIEKYDLKKISKNDQIQFFKDLRNKEIEYTGKLEELSKKPAKLDSLNRLYADGVRPECWKCVYDYQACLQPYVGVTNIVTSTPQYNTSIVSLSDGSYNILSSTTYTYTVNTVFYTVPGLSENQCTTIYKSCVASCNNGL